MRLWAAGLAASLVLLLGVPLNTAQAAEPLAYALNARLAVAHGVVDAAMWVHVRVAANESAVRLWLYPDRLRVAPSVMDEISYRWIYPGERSHGGLELSDVRVDNQPAEVRYERFGAGHERAREASGADALVEIAPGPEREVRLSLRFRLVLPARFGRLGRSSEQLRMLAPWYPLVVGDEDAFHYRVPHELTLEVVGGEAWAGQQRVRSRATVRARAAYAPVLAAAQLYALPLEVAGQRVQFVTAAKPYQIPQGEPGIWGLRDLLGIDRVRMAERALRDMALTLRSQGLPSRFRFTVVQGASRTELATVAPGVVLISDRVFETLPLKVARSFHKRAVRRAFFRQACEQLFGKLDGPRDSGWAADLRAVALTDLDEARRAGTRISPQEILAAVSFHPIVDQLLYAPQIPFEDVYFGAVAERDVFRDDPVFSRRLLSRGRRLLEAARDAMSEAEFGRFTKGLLDPGRSVRSAFGHASPRLARRLRQWLAGPSLLVNYRLAGFKSNPLSSGGFEHRIRIHRDGASVVEPVEVEARDRDGTVLKGRWHAAGEKGEVVLRSQAPLEHVQIDPRRRLVQDARLTDGHPFVDDASSLPWRPPLLQWWDVKYLPATGQYQGFADFALRRRYDLEHTIASTINASPRWSGARVLYVESFGNKVHTNRRPLILGAGMEYRRLWGFGGSEGGHRLGFLLRGGADTVAFIQDPRRGYRAIGELTLGTVRTDSGSTGPMLAGGLRASGALAFGLRNATYVVGGGDFVAGRFLPSDRPDLADGFALRGFEFGELLGDARMYGVVEHRWTALAGLDSNLLHLGWVREIQLAAFGAAGLLVNPVAPYSSRASRHLRAHAEAGVGLHLQLDYGGFQRGLIRFTFAWPLTRSPEERQGKAPMGLQFAMEQLL